MAAELPESRHNDENQTDRGLVEFFVLPGSESESICTGATDAGH